MSLIMTVHWEDSLLTIPLGTRWLAMTPSTGVTEKDNVEAHTKEAGVEAGSFLSVLEALGSFKDTLQV